MAFTDEELLARLIQCEAGGEGQLGMEAVASVVMNRVYVRDGEYARVNKGGSIRDIILQPNQFTCASTISDGAYNYAIAVITHTDGTGKIDAYSASAIAVQGGELENVGYDMVGMKWGLAAGGDNTVWHAAAIPEPTSGLLLLLGVAGLALRRRRA